MIGRKKAVTSSMMNSVRWLEEASHRVKLASGTVEDTELSKDVPSVLATPEAIFKDGVAKVISDGFQTKEDVCTGQYEQLCADNGVQ